MSAFFRLHADYLLFSGACITVFALLAWVTSARYRARFPRVAWFVLLLTLTSGWFMVERAGRAERNEIQRLLCAMAPTYALEMARMGHASMNPRHTRGRCPLPALADGRTRVVRSESDGQ